MSHTYAARRRAEQESPAPRQARRDVLAGGQSMTALMTGAEAPDTQTMGHKVDLPQAIREKMEGAFGADLSGVELYESQAVADAGAQAMTVGHRIGFAPGELDFASAGGQALLGHELSHVVSQARGEVRGSGFLRDRSLEARADREGAMAAAGESVYSGPVAPLSSSAVTAAAGPMQARKPWEKKMEISEPTLVSHESVQALEGGGYGIRGQGASESVTKKNYLSPESAALGMLTGKASKEELQGGAMKKAVLQDYVKNMKQRVAKYDNDSYESMYSGVIRDNSSGERASYDKVMRANLPEGMVEDIAKNYTPETVDDALDYAGGRVKSDAGMMEILNAGVEGLAGSAHYQGKRDLAEGMIMNGMVLRGLSPELADHGIAEQDADIKAQTGQDAEQMRYADKLRLRGEAGARGIGKNAISLGNRMMGAVNENKAKQTKGGLRFLKLLSGG